MFEEDCPPYNEAGEPWAGWPYEVFGCVYNTKEMASVIIGLMSIGCWICAQLPQLLQNYQQKSAIALAPGFLFLWLLGDTANLIGCILTDQLKTQLYTAIYFCTIDVVLWYQWFYYGFFYKRFNNTVPAEGPTETSGLIQTLDSEPATPTGKNYASLAMIAVPALLVRFTLQASTSSLTGRHLLSVDDGDSSAQIAGEVIAWLSTALYLGSRMPQIYHNYKRKSVEGLSKYLFFFAAMGNLTYSTSIFLKSVEREFLLNSLPYIIGSAGVLIFDSTIFVQFYYYRHSTYKALPSEEA